MAMIYFFASAASAFLCWRAINKGAVAEGGTEGAKEAVIEEGRSSAVQNGVEGSPGLGKTEITEGSGQPVPLALRMLQLVTWIVACLISLVVVSLFWVADVSRDVHV